MLTISMETNSSEDEDLCLRFGSGSEMNLLLSHIGTGRDEIRPLPILQLPIGFNYVSLAILARLLETTPNRENQKMVCLPEYKIDRGMCESPFEKILIGSDQTPSLFTGKQQTLNMWNYVKSYLELMFPNKKGARLSDILPHFYDRSANGLANILSVIQGDRLKVLTIKREDEVRRTIIKELNSFQECEKTCAFYFETPTYGAGIPNGCRPRLSYIPSEIEETVHKQITQWQLIWMIISWRIVLDNRAVWIPCLVYINGNNIAVIGDNYGKHYAVQDTAEEVISVITAQSYVYVAAYERPVLSFEVQMRQWEKPFHMRIDSSDKQCTSIWTHKQRPQNMLDFVIECICCPYVFMLGCGVSSEAAQAATMCLEQQQILDCFASQKDVINELINLYAKMTHWTRHLILIFKDETKISHLCALMACIADKNQGVVECTAKIAELILKEYPDNDALKSYLSIAFGMKTEEYFGYKSDKDIARHYNSTFGTDVFDDEVVPIRNVVESLNTHCGMLRTVKLLNNNVELSNEFVEYFQKLIMNVAIIP